MLRRIVLALVTLVAILSQGQSWCPSGAEWMHNVYKWGGDVNPDTIGIRRAAYVGDTLITGFTVQRIAQWDHTYPVGSSVVTVTPKDTLYTRYAEGVVYLLAGEPAVWDTAMWFDALPGQHWNWPHVWWVRYVVQDTLTEVVNGIPLKRQDVKVVLTGDTISTDRLLERVGFVIRYIDPWQTYHPDLPSGYVHYLRCYFDGSLEYTFPSTPCELPVGETEIQMAEPELPFPNPGTDHFTLSLSPGPHTITLFDAIGRISLRERTSDVRARIGTAHLPTGIYVVRVDEDLQHTRWVKQ